MTCRDKVGTQSHFSTTVWFSRLKLHFGLACQQSLLHERPLEQHVAITCSDQFVSLQAAGDRMCIYQALAKQLICCCNPLAMADKSLPCQDIHSKTLTSRYEFLFSLYNLPTDTAPASVVLHVAAQRPTNPRFMGQFLLARS